MKGIIRAAAWFILYVLLTIGLQMLLSMTCSVFGSSMGAGDKDGIKEFVNGNFLGITLLSGLITGGILLVILKIRKISLTQGLRFTRFRIKDAALTSVAAFLFSVLFSLLTSGISMENEVMIRTSVLFYNEKLPFSGMVLMALNLLVVAPITEELVFRGIVFTRVEKSESPVKAIVLSSFLFGAAHIMAGGPILAIGAILLAVLLGYAFHKTGSLWVCIIAHMIANLPDLIFFGK